jgi:hypothetical protein
MLAKMVSRHAFCVRIFILNIVDSFLFMVYSIWQISCFSCSVFNNWFSKSSGHLSKYIVYQHHLMWTLVEGNGNHQFEEPLKLLGLGLGYLSVAVELR